MSFSSPAWRLIKKGRLWRALGLPWKPDLVVEVKRSFKEVKPYPAKVFKIAFENGKEERGAVRMDKLEAFISRFVCTNGT